MASVIELLRGCKACMLTIRNHRQLEIKAILALAHYTFQNLNLKGLASLTYRLPDR
ncbi:MAG: hypothetical protein L3J98_16295 [Gammaproteobacteria bacterium]|nr:hypothetical protein [Gammaproteobacteria bacterium]